jgi:hypothetical protein
VSPRSVVLHVGVGKGPSWFLIIRAKIILLANEGIATRADAYAQIGEFLETRV